MVKLTAAIAKENMSAVNIIKMNRAHICLALAADNVTMIFGLSSNSH
jgi:hypothetical protein